MRSKQLLLLAILMVVLVVAVVLLKRPPTPTKLADEVGFERILPESLTAEAIQGVDLYQGDKKDDTVQLRRQGENWLAASYHNAPVKGDKVGKLLEGVSGLEGEVRADKAEVLEAFKLQDAEALHVLLYTDKPDQPKAHLLVGKSSGRSGFVRNAEQNRVYSVDFNLRTEAGLYGDETDKVPEAKPWLNLQLHDVPKDQVTGVELQLPERRLQLTLNKPEPEKKEEPEKAEGSEAQSDEAKADQPAAPAATPEAKPAWELVEPKVDYALKQGVVEGLVTTLRTLRGDDVVAPDNIAEYGLDKPAYRAVLTVEEEGKDSRQVTVAVGKTVSEEDEKRYIRLEQENSPVYLLPKWSFNQVFPTLGTILTLDVLSLASDEIARVSWEQDGQSLTLVRHAETPEEAKATETESQAASGEEQPAEAEAQTATKANWTWAQAPEVAVDAEKLKALLDTLERLTADDWFAETPAEAGLDQPVLSLSLTLKNGATHNVAFGQTRGKDEDRYVGLQGKAGTFVVAKTSYTSIADALKPLRPEAPDAAAAPAPESTPMPAAMPKPVMPGPEASQPASEAPTLALPKKDVAPDVSTMIKTPVESLPKVTVPSVPDPTTEGSASPGATEEVPKTTAPSTESVSPAKSDEQQ